MNTSLNESQLHDLNALGLAEKPSDCAEVQTAVDHFKWLEDPENLHWAITQSQNDAMERFKLTYQYCYENKLSCPPPPNYANFSMRGLKNLTHEFISWYDDMCGFDTGKNERPYSEEYKDKYDRHKARGDFPNAQPITLADVVLGDRIRIHTHNKLLRVQILDILTEQEKIKPSEIWDRLNEKVKACDASASFINEMTKYIGDKSTLAYDLNQGIVDVTSESIKYPHFCNVVYEIKQKILW